MATLFVIIPALLICLVVYITTTAARSVRAKRAALRGEELCWKCHRPIHKNSLDGAFCPHCGARIEKWANSSPE